MKTRLVAESEGGLFVLFDSSAVAHLRELRIEQFFKEKGYEKEALKGNLFWCDLKGDPEASFDLYIDEPIPEALVAKADRISEGSILRVPSGKLSAGGMADLPFKGELLEALEATTVSPGNYRVRTLIPTLSKEGLQGPPETLFDKISRLGCVLTAILIAVTMVFVFVNPTISAITTGVVVIYWVSYLAWYNFSGKRDEEEERRQIYLREASPSIVVELMPEAG